MRRCLNNLLTAVFAALALPVCADDSRVVVDFEQEADLKLFNFKHENEYFKDKPAFRPSFSALHATHGTRSLKVAPGEYVNSYRLPRDWSGYDSLELDVFVEGDDPVAGSVLVGDEDWKAKGNTYWNRHNGTFMLKPGSNTVSLPVNGLYRGEAGSRNNDLKYNIDPKSIIRVDIGFESAGKVAALYLDHLRLVRESRPVGILAFDFGPESQTVFPGFTPVSWNTVFGRDGATVGLRRATWGRGSARDDTFPTRLYRDYVEMAGNAFVAVVTNGKYHVWVVFDDCGYWGGETCRHSRRSISAGGREVWVDDRGPDGPSDYLFRFEKVEPRPGDNVWDLYMRDLFKPARFSVEVTDGRLLLSFASDAPMSCKVAGLIIYPDANRAESEKWVAEVEARNRKEFEDRAVCRRSGGQPFVARAEDLARGYALGFPALDQDIALLDAVPAGGSLQRTAARGQRVSCTFALRLLKPSGGPVTLSATDLKGAGGVIPSANVDLRYVHHAITRGFNDIAYRITPESLRPTAGAGVLLATNLTRQFWITVAVPADAKPGAYRGAVDLSAGDLKISLPLAIEVLDLTLDDPEFVFGFFGTHLPDGLPAARVATAWCDLFKLQKEYGMNTVSGGPSIPFKGLDGSGRPRLDFRACDDYFRAAREAGFTREIHVYGGPAMIEGLHDGYVIGETGQKWERDTGKPFGELLKIVWTAVREHGREKGWPPLAYGFTDEPRVIETAQEQLQLMRAYRESAPFVKIGGSYSVHWSDTPLDRAIQEIFKTLVYSSLNAHTPADLAKSREFNKELYIYNQGTTRFSFGAYQWAEMRKGIKGRIQWHLLALHGYQFFDLDGREPDTAMVNWGREELLPTIHLARCREGADDFRFAVTLFNRAQDSPGDPKAAAALAFLEDVNRQIELGCNEPPSAWMGDDAFREQCADHLRAIKERKRP
jgi:hypothetical protein